MGCSLHQASPPIGFSRQEYQSRLPFPSSGGPRDRTQVSHIAGRRFTLWATEKYKILMKEIKDDINRWRDISYSWIGRINIMKMTIIPKAVYRFISISVKLPMVFFTELEQKKISQFVWEHKRPKIVNQSSERRMQLEESTFLSLAYNTELQSSKEYAILIQKQKYRPMEQAGKPRGKSTYLWASYIWQMRQEYTKEKRQSLQ